MLLQGNLRVTTGEAGAMVVVNRKGRTELAAGIYALTENSLRNVREAAEETELSLAEMVAKGQRMFFHSIHYYSYSLIGDVETDPDHGADKRTKDQRKADMEAAARLLRQASTDPRVTLGQKETALFYLAACLHQLGRLKECIAVQERWLKLFPDSDLRALVLHYLACNLLEVGRTEEAVRRWKQLIGEAPTRSNLTELARWYIENRGGRK